MSYHQIQKPSTRTGSPSTITCVHTELAGKSVNNSAILHAIVMGLALINYRHEGARRT